MAPQSNEEVSVEKKIEKEALEYFTEYFRQNYPGPHTIISDPKWHAPKIFRAAAWALSQARKDNRSTTDIPAWPVQPILDRVQMCRVMLYQHGFITDAERERIDKRIDKREALSALQETPRG